MKTWHWLALGAGAYLLWRKSQENAPIIASDQVIVGPFNADPTAESKSYVVPSQTVPKVPLTAGTPDVQVIPPKADGSVAFVIPGRVNPSFSSYNGDYANGQPASRLANQ